MIVRSYTGRTVPEALAKVKNDLGDGALIIETRSIREAGLLGRKSGYEVVAAVDDSPSRGARYAVPSAPAEPEIVPWRPTSFDAPVVNQAAALSRSRSEDESSIGLEDELISIRRQLARLAAGQGTPRGHLGEELASQLDDSELPGELVAELDDAMARAGTRLAPERHRDFLGLLLARNLPCAGAIDWTTTQKMMLVGPTGVGKTTTLAKFASDLVLKRGRRVALITIDTYRVGAQDQLRTYADLLDVPLEVAASPAQFGALMRRYESYDNILIDTAGRSPGDATRIHELKGFCRAVPGLGVMLAVAATSGRAEFAAVVERFSILPIAHAVVTKLDECAAMGRLYGCLRRHHLPLNYITTGQEVPDDIVAADPAIIAGRVLPVPIAA